MSEDQTDIHLRLRALQLDYAARLPDKALEISSRFATLRSNWSPDEAMELRRLVHNLAGSGASYGFPEVSVGARKAEHALDAALAAPPTTPAEFDVVGDALSALATTLDSACRD